MHGTMPKFFPFQMMEFGKGFVTLCLPFPYLCFLTVTYHIFLWLTYMSGLTRSLWRTLELLLGSTREYDT